MSLLPTKQHISRWTTALRVDHRTRPLVLASRLPLVPKTDLPSLVIIGAQKSGTTTLHALLDHHPQLASSFIKETRFFDMAPDRGLPWYRAHFQRREPGVLSFEASPDYILMPWAPPAVAAAVPDALIVLLVREPIARAHSHWAMNRSRGREHLEFTEALQAEAARLAHGAGTPRSPEGYRYLHYSYSTRGHYAAQLERWLDWYPRDRVLVLGNHELATRQNEVLRMVTDRLGIEPMAPIEKTRKNTRSYEEMAPEARAFLEAEFATAHDDLVKLIGGGPYW